MRKTLTVAIAAITLAAGFAVPAYAKPIIPDSIAIPATSGLQQVQYRNSRYNRCYAGERKRDCKERMRWERNHGGDYQYRNGRYYSRDDRNDSAAIAILGFVLGAAIQGDQSDYDYYYSRRQDRRYLDGCRTRYRSFDRSSGTYMTSNGYRRYCRY